jgi:ribosomal protein S1
VYRYTKVNAVLANGTVCQAKVVEVMPFGWILQLEPNGERGLLHVTEFSHGGECCVSLCMTPIGQPCIANQ